MKTRAVLASLAAFLAGVAEGIAADAHMGTWKLNESKSKLGAGATKNLTVIYAAAGDELKVTVSRCITSGRARSMEKTTRRPATRVRTRGPTGRSTIARWSSWAREAAR